MTTTAPSPAQQKTNSLITIYHRFAHFMDHWQSLVLLLIRGYIGYQCAFSGYAHITHFHNTVEAFKSWHIPMPEVNVAFSAIVELVCGTLLALGFAARLVSLPLIGNFVVAILAVNLSDEKFRPLILHFWNNPDVILKDDAFLFLATAVLILVFGPGAFSIDGIIKRVRRTKK